MRQHLATNKSLYIKTLTVLAVVASMFINANSAYAVTKEDAKQSALKEAATAATRQQQSQLQHLQQLPRLQQQQISSDPNLAQNYLIDGKTEEQKAAERRDYLGTAADEDSLMSKTLKLAEKAERDRQLENGQPTEDEADIIDMLPPPEIEALQYITKGENNFKGSIIEGGETGAKIAQDMRRKAQKEAALSYGARGGLAKRSYQIAERMRDFERVLDNVFKFRALLIKAPSGLLIEPPIIKESLDALLIEDDGSKAAIAQGVFDINKKAQIVSAPRDWRHYIIQSWSSKIKPPPKILWPQNDEEQLIWNEWVAKGWQAGIAQSEKIFELNTNRLTADYQGMVRYKMLLAQGMVSAPYTTHEERGVTGDGNQMRIGDSALKITSPSQFIIGANTWKPADR